MYAMENLHTDGNWTAVSGTVDFKRTMRNRSRPVYSYVAHAMYRISLEIGNNQALEFALRVDLTNPADLDEFHAAMEDVGATMEIEVEVEVVLAALGIEVSDTSNDSDDNEDDAQSVTPPPAEEAALPAPSALPSVQLSDCGVKNYDGFGAIEAYLSVNSNGYVVSPGQLRIQGMITGQRLTDYQETIFANSQDLNYVTGRALRTGGGETAVSVFVSLDWSNLDTGNFGAVGDSCIVRRITARLHSSHRSRQPIWLGSVPGSSGRVGPARIDEPPRQPVRQCPSGEFHQNGEIRRGLSQRLRDLPGRRGTRTSIPRSGLQ